MTGHATEHRRISLQAQKQEVLDVLDRLLGHQDNSRSAKVAALREVERAARRMADQIERHEAIAMHAGQHGMEQNSAAVTQPASIRFSPEMSGRIAREVEAIAWNEGDLLHDIPEVGADANYLASTYAELAADTWEDQNELSFGSLPGRVIDAARKALIPRIEAEIERRGELVLAEYVRRQREGLIDVNGVGSVPSYYELIEEKDAFSRPDSGWPAWMEPEILLMSTRAALITHFHFECPECGMTDAELGPADAHTLLCEICLEEDRHIRLKRWPVDEDLGALPARRPA
jgi:hypothetical protein